VTSPVRGSLPRVADRPRLLHRSSIRGYTDQKSQALRSGRQLEPEAIPEELQREYSAEARRRWEVVKADELARKASRSRCGRLKKVDQDARRRGIDIHRHLAAIEREIALAEQLVTRRRDRVAVPDRLGREKKEPDPVRLPH
jgi:hypothetical protein